jgi:hypothetical protein
MNLWSAFSTTARIYSTLVEVRNPIAQFLA